MHSTRGVPSAPANRLSSARSAQKALNRQDQKNSENGVPQRQGHYDFKTFEAWQAFLGITVGNDICKGIMSFLGPKDRKPFDSSREYAPEKGDPTQVTKGQIYYAQSGRIFADNPHYHTAFEEIYKYLEGTSPITIIQASVNERGEVDASSLREIRINPGEKCRIPKNTIHCSFLATPDDWAVAKIDTYPGWSPEGTTECDLTTLPRNIQEVYQKYAGINQ